MFTKLVFDEKLKVKPDSLQHAVALEWIGVIAMLACGPFEYVLKIQTDWKERERHATLLPYKII